MLIRLCIPTRRGELLKHQTLYHVGTFAPGKPENVVADMRHDLHDVDVGTLPM